MPEEIREEIDQRNMANQIAEHVSRYILGVGQYPEFGVGGVPIKVVATVYGKDAAWVRAGITNGWLPIGHVTSFSGERRSFYVSPRKLWEDTGYVWKGEKEIQAFGRN